MHRKLNDFLNENLTYGEKILKIKKDIELLNINDPIVIHMVKDMLISIFDNNEEKYNDIIDIIKYQIEHESIIKRTPRSKYTNVEYLKKKSAYDISIIKNKWSKIIQSEKDEEI